MIITMEDYILALGELESLVVSSPKLEIRYGPDQGNLQIGGKAMDERAWLRWCKRWGREHND